MSNGNRMGLAALGIILLLPGLCSVFAMGEFGTGGFHPNDWPIYGLWLATFAIALGGFILLRKAYRG